MNININKGPAKVNGRSFASVGSGESGKCLPVASIDPVDSFLDHCGLLGAG